MLVQKCALMALRVTSTECSRGVCGHASGVRRKSDAGRSAAARIAADCRLRVPPSLVFAPQGGAQLGRRRRTAPLAQGMTRYGR